MGVAFAAGGASSGVAIGNLEPRIVAAGTVIAKLRLGRTDSRTEHQRGHKNQKKSHAPPNPWRKASIACRHASAE